ncbi:MAG: hypothetical protein OSA84_02090 [Akkermansiaceae bacterium]|nr:hypothetical protein [Akkermansiaceae bacterium]
MRIVSYWEIFAERAAVEKMYLKGNGEMVRKLGRIPEGNGTMLDNDTHRLHVLCWS